jgi:hypothetical protein
MTDREKRQWEKERAKGFGRYLLQRGLLLYGLGFGILMTLMQIVSHETATPEKRLINFLIYVVGFGGLMGVITWRLNENDYQKPSDDGDGDAD